MISFSVIQKKSGRQEGEGEEASERSLDSSHLRFWKTAGRGEGEGGSERGLDSSQCISRKRPFEKMESGKEEGRAPPAPPRSVWTWPVLTDTHRYTIPVWVPSPVPHRYTIYKASSTCLGSLPRVLHTKHRVPVWVPSRSLGRGLHLVALGEEGHAVAQTC